MAEGFGQFIINRLDSGEETDKVYFLPVSSLMFKLHCSLTLFNFCCIGYLIFISTVKHEI